MWVLAGGVLVQLPDDVPVPSGSRAVDVPEDFALHPHHYRVTRAGLARRSDEQIEQDRAKRERARLTPEEVAIVKRAIGEGRLEPAPEEGSARSPRRRTARAESAGRRRNPT